MKVGKTTAVGVLAVLAGVLGSQIGLSHDTQAQLIAFGGGAICGRDTLGKILDALKERGGPR